MPETLEFSKIGSSHRGHVHGYVVVVQQAVPTTLSENPEKRPLLT
jgi:hypothetical protein